MNTTLKVYLNHPLAVMPELATEWSACFDLRACFEPGDEISLHNSINEKSVRTVDEESSIYLYPKERMLIPTGLIFDLDETQSVRIHPRSSLGWKFGVTIPHSEGIVDADYIHETFILLQNNSDLAFPIAHGDRLLQAEVVENVMRNVAFAQVDAAPEAKTSRAGGLGSTGTE